MASSSSSRDGVFDEHGNIEVEAYVHNSQTFSFLLEKDAAPDYEKLKQSIMKNLVLSSAGKLQTKEGKVESDSKEISKAKLIDVVREHEYCLGMVRSKKLDNKLIGHCVYSHNSKDFRIVINNEFSKNQSLVPPINRLLGDAKKLSPGDAIIAKLTSQGSINSYHKIVRLYKDDHDTVYVDLYEKNPELKSLVNSDKVVYAVLSGEGQVKCYLHGIRSVEDCFVLNSVEFVSKKADKDKQDNEIARALLKQVQEFYDTPGYTGPGSSSFSTEREQKNFQGEKKEETGGEKSNYKIVRIDNNNNCKEYQDLCKKIPGFKSQVTAGTTFFVALNADNKIKSYFSVSTSNGQVSEAKLFSWNQSPNPLTEDENELIKKAKESYTFAAWSTYPPHFMSDQEIAALEEKERQARVSTISKNGEIEIEAIAYGPDAFRDLLLPKKNLQDESQDSEPQSENKDSDPVIKEIIDSMKKRLWYVWDSSGKVMLRKKSPDERENKNKDEKEASRNKTPKKKTKAAPKQLEQLSNLDRNKLRKVLNKSVYHGTIVRTETTSGKPFVACRIYTQSKKGRRIISSELDTFISGDLPKGDSTRDQSIADLLDQAVLFPGESCERQIKTNKGSLLELVKYVGKNTSYWSWKFYGNEKENALKTIRNKIRQEDNISDEQAKEYLIDIAYAVMQTRGAQSQYYTSKELMTTTSGSAFIKALLEQEQFANLKYIFEGMETEKGMKFIAEERKSKDGSVGVKKLEEEEAKKKAKEFSWHYKNIVDLAKLKVEDQPRCKGWFISKEVKPEPQQVASTDTAQGQTESKEKKTPEASQSWCGWFASKFKAGESKKVDKPNPFLRPGRYLIKP